MSRETTLVFPAGRPVDRAVIRAIIQDLNATLLHGRVRIHFWERDGDDPDACGFDILWGEHRRFVATWTMASHTITSRVTGVHMGFYGDWIEAVLVHGVAERCDAQIREDGEMEVHPPRLRRYVTYTTMLKYRVRRWWWIARLICPPVR
jgi:hypothetical protein